MVKSRPSTSVAVRSKNATPEKLTTSKASAPQMSRPIQLPAGPQKEIEFRFTAPSAHLVKLAGDFTEWEGRPIQMVQLTDGTWFTTVPLSPGSYSYRFIADGQWCDDSLALLHAPNPFGGQNSVVRVS